MTKTLRDLNKEIDSAQLAVEEQMRNLYEAETTLRALKKERGEFVCPFNEGDKLVITKEGKVIRDGVPLGYITLPKYLSGATALLVCEIETFDWRPYYAVKVRKKRSRESFNNVWTKLKYDLPYLKLKGKR